MSCRSERKFKFKNFKNFVFFSCWQGLSEPMMSFKNQCLKNINPSGILLLHSLFSFHNSYFLPLLQCRHCLLRLLNRQKIVQTFSKNAKGWRIKPWPMLEGNIKRISTFNYILLQMSYQLNCSYGGPQAGLSDS